MHSRSARRPFGLYQGFGDIFQRAAEDSRLQGLLTLSSQGGGYGTGLAGSFVLREVIWANFFGRNSLGTVRGLSLFFSNLFAASGAPFFGFLHDRTGSYNLSFTIFSCALFTSSR